MSLSDKIQLGHRFKFWFHEKDLKQSIKELKDIIKVGKKANVRNKDKWEMLCEFERAIAKVFGEGLV